MSFIEDVKAKAKARMKTIVLPEAEDKRTLEAAQQIKKEGFASAQKVFVKSRDGPDYNRQIVKFFSLP